MDLIAEDDDSTTVLPKVIAAGVVVTICAAIAIGFSLMNMNKPAEAPVASNTAPPAPVKENFTESRVTPAGPVQQTSFVPPPPRVFLPPNVSNITDSFRESTNEVKSEHNTFSKLTRERDEGSYMVAGAKLTNSRKPNGDMVCYGTIKIVNRSIDNIVDFDIYLIQGKKKFVVKPFIGTLDNIEPLATHVVHAKEALTMPIYVDQYKGNPGPVDGHLTVVATLDSTPKPQYLETDLDKGPTKEAPAKSKKR